MIEVIGIVFIITFMMMFMIWYICALIFIACELWQYNCDSYTRFGWWVCKIATLGIKE